MMTSRQSTNRSSESSPASPASPERESVDSAPLDSWVDEHGDILYRFARLRVADEHVIEDLLQETYLAALRGYEKFRGDAEIRSWLIAILRFKILDHFRNKKRQEERQAAIEDELPIQRENRLEAWPGEAAQLVENEEFWKAFHECLVKLPTILSEAFVLRELEDVPRDTMCELLGIRANNLSIRLFRARTLLRDCLDKNWFARGRK